MDIEQAQPRRAPYPLVTLTAAERTALQQALLSVKALPRSLSLVPVPGALEVWARRKIPGGSRWVRVQSIPAPPGPGRAAGSDDVHTDFMPL